MSFRPLRTLGFLKTWQGFLRWNSVHTPEQVATEGLWSARGSGSSLALTDFVQKQGGLVVANRQLNLRSFSANRGFVMEDPRLKEVLDYLESLKNYEKEGVPKGAGTDSKEGFDLQRMRRFLQLLGNPLSRYPVVHIAGTKGKGSTTAFISNILREEGYSVGTYTSPHLQTIRERIVTGRNDEAISAEAFYNLFQGVRGILDNALHTEHGSLTHFEVLTALAFEYFAQEGVDIAVIEAGLGGARDATNVICSEGLATAVITTIGEEHMIALGGSLESIAIAKSGIIKQGRPVVLGGPFEPRIEYILRKTAASMHAPVISAFDPGIQSTIKSLETINNQPCQYSDILVSLDENDPHMIIELFGVRLRMLGYHQLQNAVTATCTALCLRSQGWRISDDSIRAGLERTCLLGRSQFVTPEQAKMLGLNRATIILDGAHTEASAKALADTIRMAYPDKPLAFVIAMASDKDHSAFARHLLSVKNKCIRIGSFLSLESSPCCTLKSTWAGTQFDVGGFSFGILSGAFPKVTILTEVSVAGGTSRITPAASLLRTWIQTAHEHNISVIDWSGKQSNSLPTEKDIIFSDQNLQRPLQENLSLVVAKESRSVEQAIKMANELLELVSNQCSGIICITGSLHIVSTVMSSLRD